MKRTSNTSECRFMYAAQGYKLIWPFCWSPDLQSPGSGPGIFAERSEFVSCFFIGVIRSVLPPAANACCEGLRESPDRRNHP